jgi:hypothetical protein
MPCLVLRSLAASIGDTSSKAVMEIDSNGPEVIPAKKARSHFHDSMAMNVRDIWQANSSHGPE